MSVDFIVKLLPTFCKVIQLFRRKKPNRGVALVVEDDPQDALLLHLELRRAGFECEIAETAELARGFILHTFYPLVFVDLRLPGMSGEAFLRLLQVESPESKAVIICGDPTDLRTFPAGEPFICIRKNAHVKGLKELFKTLNIK